MGSLKIAINVMREKGNKWVGETLNNGLKYLWEKTRRNGRRVITISGLEMQKNELSRENDE